MTPKCRRKSSMVASSYSGLFAALVGRGGDEYRPQDGNITSPGSAFTRSSTMMGGGHSTADPDGNGGFPNVNVGVSCWMGTDDRSGFCASAFMTSMVPHQERPRPAISLCIAGGAVRMGRNAAASGGGRERTVLAFEPSCEGAPLIHSVMCSVDPDRTSTSLFGCCCQF
jgi:hypothetical protein